MEIGRRGLFKIGAAAGLLAMPSARALAGSATTLVLYDSSIPLSRALAAKQGGTLVDVAQPDQQQWHNLRRNKPAGRIIGFTRWSDAIHARMALQDHGKRLRTERNLSQSGLFHWEIA